MGQRVCQACWHLESDHINGAGDPPERCWVRLTNRTACGCAQFQAE